MRRLKTSSAKPVIHSEPIITEPMITREAEQQIREIDTPSHESEIFRVQLKEHKDLKDDNNAIMDDLSKNEATYEAVKKAATVAATSQLENINRRRL